MIFTYFFTFVFTMIDLHNFYMVYIISVLKIELEVFIKMFTD